MRFDSFGGDVDGLERFIATEWAEHYKTEQHFAYPAAWLAAFLGEHGNDPELVVECRDDEGVLAGFAAAVPRRAHIEGREVRLALLLLLTAGRRPSRSVPALGLLRELFRRAPTRGIDAIYYFTVGSQRVHELVGRAAAIENLATIELAPVGSLMAIARAAPEPTPNVRRLATGELSRAIELLDGVARALPIGRLLSTEALAASKALAVWRGDRPTAVCVYAPRQMVGTSMTDVCNVDFLVGPDATPPEAAELGRALAAEAAAAGAQVVVAPARGEQLFPHNRHAGFRKGGRTLRTFVVPISPGSIVAAGAAHFLEVE